MSNTTSRIGKSWDNNEEKELINEIEKFTVEEIAELHKRTINGVKYRIIKILCEKQESGENINHFLVKFAINQQSIVDHVGKNKLAPSTYSMARKRWSEYEDALLLKEADGNIDLTTMSQSHHRSPSSISLRLLRLLSDKYKSESDLTAYYTKGFFTEKEMKHYVSYNK